MERPLRIAIYEDAVEDADLLLQCISQSEIAAESSVFSSAQALLANFSAEEYDLIFLDIYMGTVQAGVDLASKIREIDTNVTLAFITSSKEHALESYRLKAFAYLEKPVRGADVREVLLQAVNKRKNAPAIKLLVAGERRDILLDQIIYFEQRDRAVYINTLTETLRASQTVKLSDIETMLPNAFLRCHHSYIAHLRYVKELDQEMRVFIMQNGDYVYIRRQDVRKAARMYEDYLFRRKRGGENEG